MSLDVTLLLQGFITHTSPADLSTPTDEWERTVQYDWTDGVAVDQANRIFHDERTITASSNEDLDLAGSLTDKFGATITFARIKALIIEADDANANNVHVGGAASNPFINWVANSSDIVVVRPGGLFALIAPDATAYAVTAGSGDLLRIANSGAGTSVVYRIWIIGAAT